MIKVQIKQSNIEVNETGTYYLLTSWGLYCFMSKCVHFARGHAPWRLADKRVNTPRYNTVRGRGLSGDASLPCQQQAASSSSPSSPSVCLGSFRMSFRRPVGRAEGTVGFPETGKARSQEQEASRGFSERGAYLPTWHVTVREEETRTQAAPVSKSRGSSCWGINSSPPVVSRVHTVKRWTGCADQSSPSGWVDPVVTAVCCR